VGGEGGAEAGLLQRDVDELLVREAGAQSASAAAAAHFSSEVLRWEISYGGVGMCEQGDGAGTGTEEMREKGKSGEKAKSFTHTGKGPFRFHPRKFALTPRLHHLVFPQNYKQGEKKTILLLQRAAQPGRRSILPARGFGLSVNLTSSERSALGRSIPFTSN
jgi:hypothetical protein